MMDVDHHLKNISHTGPPFLNTLELFHQVTEGGVGYCIQPAEKIKDRRLLRWHFIEAVACREKAGGGRRHPTIPSAIVWPRHVCGEKLGCHWKWHPPLVQPAAVEEP